MTANSLECGELIQSINTFMEIFLVGGAVRDKLLGRAVNEKDWVVVGATPQAMIAQGFQPVGKDFPVFLHPQTKEEYALARTERKTGPGYTGFQFYAAEDVTLEQDLIRRDLTINAMAENAAGELIDPFGGAADLHNRVLRHVSPAFAEDPVRVLRIARFAARYHHLGFKVAPETLELMRTMVTSGEVDHLVAERVWKEMSRALMEPDPDVFFATLRDCGALARIIPEVDALFGVPQRPEYHPEVDTGAHTLMALRQACRLSQSVDVRFAVLLHDLGKAQTPPKEWPRHQGHEVRGLPLVREVCQRLAAPKSARDLALAAAEFHLHCHRAPELTPATLVNTLEKLDAFRRPERFRDFLLCCEADARGRAGLEDRDYPQAEYFAGALQACTQVSVADLLAKGLTGAALGQALHQERIQAVQHFQQERQTRS
jgi:tRNA nucleotidyltransferase (CCA-adding enzyme)